MKISKREQWLLFVVIAAVVLYVFQVYLLAPQFSKITALKGDIKIAKLQIQVLEEKEKQLKKIQARAPQQIRRKTKEENAITVINYVTDTISTLGLNLLSLKPNYEETALKQANVMRFDLIIEGNYNQLYKFVRALEDSPDLLTIDLFKQSRKSASIITTSIAVLSYY